MTSSDLILKSNIYVVQEDVFSSVQSLQASFQVLVHRNALEDFSRGLSELFNKSALQAVSSFFSHNRFRHLSALIFVFRIQITMSFLSCCDIISYTRKLG